MKSDAHLIITHGTSDLQILLSDDSGRRWRAMPDKTIVRRFHQWLLEREADVVVIDTPPELQERKHEATFTDWNDDTFALWLSDGSPDAYPERDADGRLQLMLPKIEPALNKWTAELTWPAQAAQTAHPPADQALCAAEVQPSPLSKVLVLSTDRGEDAQEPVATFFFLKRWLTQKNVPENAISEYIFLHPGQRLEDGDSPIAPTIAQRIEKAVIGFYQPGATLLIASMGGLPQIKPLLAELAALIAGPRAQSLFKTEHGALGLLSQTPIDALRVRRQCLEQIRRGALLDAWAMAAPFHSDQDARLWVRPLKQAAQLLNGNPVDASANDVHTLPALKRIIERAKRTSCLLVAIRVETALQNERWLEAINGTFTFFEAAFHDAIKGWARDAHANYDIRRRRITFSEAPPNINILLESKALDRWIGFDAQEYDYIIDTVGEKSIPAWDEFLNIKSLQRLRHVFTDPIQPCGFRRIKDYRNYNTHGILTQDEIDEAIKCFMGAGLWSQGVNNPAMRPKPGKAFLGRKLISDVINELSDKENDPAESAQILYQNLLQQLESCLIDPDSPLF